LGASISASIAAGAHALFNVIGTVIFLTILGPITCFITFLQGTLDLNPAMVIAFENIIDSMERVLSKKHIRLLNEGQSSGDEMNVFDDIFVI